MPNLVPLGLLDVQILCWNTNKRNWGFPTKEYDLSSYLRHRIFTFINFHQLICMACAEFWTVIECNNSFVSNFFPGLLNKSIHILSFILFLLLLWIMKIQWQALSSYRNLVLFISLMFWFPCSISVASRKFKLIRSVKCNKWDILFSNCIFILFV